MVNVTICIALATLLNLLVPEDCLEPEIFYTNMLLVHSFVQHRDQIRTAILSYFEHQDYFVQRLF